AACPAFNLKRAWTTLVEEVNRARGWPSLHVNVATWDTIGEAAKSSSWSTLHAQVQQSAATWLALDSTVHGRNPPDSIDDHRPIIGVRLTPSALAETPLNVPERA